MLAPWVDNEGGGRAFSALPHLQLKDRKDGSEELLGSVGEPLLSKGILRKRLHRKSIVTSSGSFFKLYCIVRLFFFLERNKAICGKKYILPVVSLKQVCKALNKHPVGQQSGREWEAAEPFLPQLSDVSSGKVKMDVKKQPGGEA